MSRVRLPAGVSCELIVLDNGSTDDTANVVPNAALGRMELRYVLESRSGKSHALNTGLSLARGEIILFTDDDVCPPANWIEEMCQPMWSGRAYAVAGGVRISTRLERPWMDPLHRVWLAECVHDSGVEASSSEVELVGANMGVARAVLTRVPGFDLGLGPAALGNGEDVLFSKALKRAGYRIEFVPAYAEHCFDESRLQRANFIVAARDRGRSAAYIAYHWDHQEIPLPAMRLAKRRLLLLLKQYLRGREPEMEGMPTWEMHALWSVAYYEQFLLESKTPRRYPAAVPSAPQSTTLLV